MQFDKFEHKVKEAAEQHHPSYDETAWAKMEKLLDREMPQKKDRRRVLPFLLAFLLLAGGAGLLLTQPWGSGGKTASQPSKLTVPAEQPAVSTKESGANDPVAVPEVKETRDGDPGNSQDPETAAVKTHTTNENATSGIPRPAGDNISARDHQRSLTTGNHEPAGVKSKTVSAQSLSSGASKRRPAARQRNPAAGLDQLAQLTVTADQAGRKKRSTVTKGEGGQQPADASGLPATTSVADGGLTSKPTTSNEPGLTTGNTTGTPPATTEDKQEPVAEKAAPKAADPVVPAPVNPAAKKRSGWSFAASLGPDLSYVALDRPGKMKLVGGLGVGYTIRRLTIRAGFYTTNKVYSATKEQYKPSTPIMGYNYLQQIDARCRVYEIPVGLTYSFSRSARGGWFAATSLSTLLMKKEVYDYRYAYPNNPNPYTYTRTIDNKNKHYFSVLTLSAGYQRMLTRTISVAAEPYVKLPLSGVGYGKVKLNSMGALFSIIATPF